MAKRGRRRLSAAQMRARNLPGWRDRLAEEKGDSKPYPLPDCPPVSVQLRMAIEANGIPWSVLAAECSLGTSTLNRFMNKDRGLQLETVDRLCDELGLSLYCVLEDKAYIICDRRRGEFRADDLGAVTNRQLDGYPIDAGDSTAGEDLIDVDVPEFDERARAEITGKR